MTANILYVSELSQQLLGQEYAQQFAFDIRYQPPLSQLNYYLCLQTKGLFLHNNQDNETLCVDFLAGKQAHRFYFGGGQGQDIAKAVGVSQYKPTVLDLTAGLAQDAFVLAALGCQVHACEKQPVIAALVLDALKRALAASDEQYLAIQDALKRLEYQFINAQDYLQQCNTRFDVIYLDPMFEAGSYAKSQVKKEAKALRLLAQDPFDAQQLLVLALQHARCRVVVKRPKKGEFLAQKTPSFQIKGKSNRYDVYVLQQVKAGN